MFKKVLIANRGEIACRIARTCHRLGVAVAGVHSTADRNALHVKTIGESIEIGGGPAAESYLRIDTLIDAAKRTGAEAIHPGFGFLAENADFVRAVEAAGLVFIGPTAQVIGRLGDKAAAKQEAKAADVPTVPGSLSPSQDPAEVARIVRSLRPPVMLKAAAGGGGKGMRALTSLQHLDDDIESAMREAKNAFGHAGLIVEQLLECARHIEVQIVGDGKGEVVHLFERECSLQRRHQKIIEEAPAANLDPGLRDRITADAVRLGQRLRYRGAGTVEFILRDGVYYFLEVNPRLQVEHPVSEMVTGVDIVELMLRIAAGEGLPFRQGKVQLSGHAVEARLYAEDPATGFLPSTGRLGLVKFPAAGVRVETGIESGSEVTPYYDPMLAKLIAHAETRDAALDKLKHALDDTAIFGVTTNRDFLKRLIDLPETRAATFHTRLIDERLDGLLPAAKPPAAETLAIAAFYWMQRQRGEARDGPWRARDMTGWQMSTGADGLGPIPALHLECAGQSAEIRFAAVAADGSMIVAVNGEKVRIKLVAATDDAFLAVLDARQEMVRVRQEQETLYVHDRRGTHTLTAIPYLAYVTPTAKKSGDLRAPMMGLILKLSVAIGDKVSHGDVVAVLESMKMELRIKSECDGVVTAVNCRVGETVERNAVVVVVEPE